MASAPGVWPADAPCPDADYRDTFVAPCANAADRTGEQWMRECLEGAPLLLRSFVAIGWRLVLGFEPSRSDAILGWPIVGSAPEYVLLEQQSRLFHAALLLDVGQDRLVWATRVVYRARAAKPMWAVVKIVHRSISPYLLKRAARRHAR
ncbi:MAG TPA: hypothetical protein VG899_00665 [Mycobacteriales bacterium]|nr:hypothetical protein [Mycobacteriales bacterium]